MFSKLKSCIELMSFGRLSLIINQSIIRNGFSIDKMYKTALCYLFDYSGVLLHLSNPFNLRTRTPGLFSSR